MEKEEITRPKVSVFVTAYNRKEFIKQCIQSIISQSMKDFEICVCDDGSNDGTSEILNQLRQKYNTTREIIRIKRHKKNLGIAKAYNTALQMCKGEYIAQLDSDDLLYKNALQRLAGFLDSNQKIGLVFSDFNIFDINKKIFLRWDPILDHNNLKKEFFRKMTLNHLSMFRRNLLAGLKISEDLQTAIDYDLYIKIAEKTEISHISEALYLYRVHNNNVSLMKGQSYNPFQQASATLIKARSAKRRAKCLYKNMVTKNN